MGTIREPQKKTSIEKKNKIIDAGLRLFSEKGYFKTNTAEIAKTAGVSTGIVYQYFKDKKDILIYAINRFFKESYQPIFKALEDVKDDFSIEKATRAIIDAAIKTHENNSLAHAEMLAVGHVDEEVHEVFENGEHEIIHLIIDFLEEKGYKNKNLHEKVHIAYNLIEALCHEALMYKHSDVDYNIIIEENVELIKYLFRD